MSYGNKFLIVLGILLAGCLLVSGSFAADISVNDVSNDSSISIDNNLEKFTLNDSNINDIQNENSINILSSDDTNNVNSISSLTFVSEPSDIQYQGTVNATVRVYSNYGWDTIYYKFDDSSSYSTESVYSSGYSNVTILKNYYSGNIGTHTLYVSSSYNFKNNISATFRVKAGSKSCNIQITSMNSSVSEDSKITAKILLSKDSTGSSNCLYYWYDTTSKPDDAKNVSLSYSWDNTYSCQFETTGLSKGTHTLYVYYAGDKTYNEGTASRSFTVTESTKQDCGLKFTTYPSDISSGSTGTAEISLPNYKSSWYSVYVYYWLDSTTKPSSASSAAVYSKYSTVSISYSSSTLGTHTLYVCYEGDDSYKGKTISASFNVTEQVKESCDLTFEYSPSDVSKGEKVNATFSLCMESSGNCYYWIDNNASTNKSVYVYKSSYLYDYVEREISYDTSALSVGTHKLYVYYAGDDTYLGKTISASFKVNKMNSSIEVSDVPSSVEKGKDITGTISVKTDGTNNYAYYWIDNNKSTNTSVELSGWYDQKSGSISFNTSDLSEGSHTLNVYYAGDNTYSSSYDSVQFSVDLKDSGLSFYSYPSDVDKGENVTATVQITSDLVGKNIEFSFDGINWISCPIEDYYYNYYGRAYISYNSSNLAAGYNNLSVRYQNDGTYKTSVISHGFNVNLKSVYMQLSVSPSWVESGKNVTATVNMSKELIGQNVYFKVNDGSWVQKVLGSSSYYYVTADYVINTSDLKNGVNTIYVKYDSDGIYESKEDNSTFTVTKKSCNIRFIEYPSSPYTGSNVTAVIGVLANSTGRNVTFWIDDNMSTAYTVVLTDGYFNDAKIGNYSYNTAGLTTGSHTLHVYYDGDSIYANGTTSYSFSIKEKEDPNLDIVDYSQQVLAGNNITAKIRIGGYSYGNFSGKHVSVRIDNGEWVELTLESEYLYSYYYYANYTNSSVGLDLGTHYLYAKYDGDENHSESIVNVTFNINPKYSELRFIIQPVDTYTGSNVTAEIGVLANSSGRNVTFWFDNNMSTAKVVSLSNSFGGDAKYAYFTYNSSDLNIGPHILHVLYEGDSVYSRENITSNYFWVKEKITTNLVIESYSKDVWVSEENVTALIRLSDYSSSNFTGKFIYVSIDDGEWTQVAIESKYFYGYYYGNYSSNSSALAIGSHILKVKYDGDENHSASVANCSFNVYKKDPRLNIVNTTYFYTIDTNITFQGIIDNKTIGEKVYFRIDDGEWIDVVIVGEQTPYHGIVGAANFTFNTSDIGFKNHTLFVKYEGNDIFNESIKNYTFNVVHKNSWLTIDFISPETIVLGDNVTAFISIYTNSSNRNVTFWVDDHLLTQVIELIDFNQSIRKDLRLANYTINSSDLDAGNHTFYVSYDGDSIYSWNFDAYNFTVNKLDITIDVSVNATEILYGESVKVIANLSHIVSGNVTLVIDGIEKETKILKDINPNANDLRGNYVEFEVSDLGLGSHNITVIYNGNNYYISKASEIETIIIKQGNLTLDINVNPAEIVFGESTTVTGTLSKEVSGNVTIFVDGVKGETKDLNGLTVVTFDVTGLTVGVHNVTLVYNGNENYTAKYSDVKNVTVKQAGLDSISVVVDPVEIVYGDSTNVTVTVDPVVSGNVTVFVDGVPFNTKDLVDGVVVFNITNLNAGVHNITARFNGNENYTAKYSDIKYVTVKQAGLDSISVVVDPVEIVYGDSTNVTVTVDPVVSGNVTVFVDGNPVNTKDLVDGVVVFNIAGLNAGVHNITARFNGNENYTAKSSDIKYVTVKQAGLDSISVVVDPVEIVYGDSTNVTVVVDPVVSGNVTVFVDGNSVNTKDLVNGKVVFDIAGLTVGIHNITARFNGNDNYISKVSDVNYVTVKRADITLDIVVNPTEIAFGDFAIVTGIVSKVVSGNVTIFIDGVANETKDLNGLTVVTFNVTGLTVGVHNVTLVYNGNENYTNKSSGLKYVTVKQAGLDSISVVVDPVEIVYGDSTNVTVVVDPVVSGNVTVFVDGNSVNTKDLVNGKVVFNIAGLNAGTHNIKAVFNGNENYTNKSSGLKYVTVKQAGLDSISVVVDPAVIVYGDSTNVTVAVDPVVSGNVTVFVDGNSVNTKDLVDGVVVFDIAGLNAGVHNITARFNGNDDYTAKVSDVKNVFVNQAKVDNLSIVVDPREITLGDSTNVTVTVDPVVSGNVTVFVDGNSVNTKDLVDGVVVFDIAGLNAGVHNITARFNGNENYLPQYGDETNITVNKVVPAMDITVTPEEIKFNDDVTITVNLPEDATGNVTFIINGKNTTVDIVDGVANITLEGLASGDYTIDVIYSGDDKYASMAKNVSFNIEKRQSYLDVTIGSESSFVIYENDSIIVAVQILYPVDGGYASVDNAQGYVLVTICGKTVNATVVDGMAYAKFDSLPAGEYDVFVWYSGDGNYTECEGNYTFEVESLPAPGPTPQPTPKPIPKDKVIPTLPNTGNPLVILLITLITIGVGSLKRKF